jgi:hypothetical protein
MGGSEVHEDGQVAEGRRGGGSATDMVRSLVVVLAVIAVVLLLSTRHHPAVSPTVDYTTALAEARSAASYPVSAPDRLGAGWRPTSARTTRNGAAVEWHIGFVTPAEDYAGLEQSDGPRAAFLGRFTEGAEQVGVVRIGDRSWRRLTGGRPELRALELREGGTTTLVAGNAKFAELQRLAASLRGG